MYAFLSVPAPLGSAMYAFLRVPAPLGSCMYAFLRVPAPLGRSHVDAPSAGILGAPWKVYFVVILRGCALWEYSGGTLECRFYRYLGWMRPLGAFWGHPGKQVLSLFCVDVPSGSILGAP